MGEAELRLVNVWTDPEPGAGGFNPMAHSLLWWPAGQRPGDTTPGIVFVHGWGGYPYDEWPVELGPVGAGAGLPFLSLCLRRRGMEGQLLALPDNDQRDIKLAIDAVACLVDGLGDRLGDDAATMRDALNNIRLAFVQIKGATETPES